MRTSSIEPPKVNVASPAHPVPYGYSVPMASDFDVSPPGGTHEEIVCVSLSASVPSTYILTDLSAATVNVTMCHTFFETVTSAEYQTMFPYKEACIVPLPIDLI